MTACGDGRPPDGARGEVPVRVCMGNSVPRAELRPPEAEGFLKSHIRIFDKVRD